MIQKPHMYHSLSSDSLQPIVDLNLQHIYERVLSQPVHGTATYKCDDTRGCIIQFLPPDDEHMVLETCRGMK